MLGILQVNEQKLKNGIFCQIVTVGKMQFFEVIVDLKNLKEHFYSKVMINKALRIFEKNDVFKVCAKKEFQVFFEKHNLQIMSHFDILYAKRFEILKMLDKKTIFVHSKTYDITDMVGFLAKNFDDIFLDIKVRKNEIKREFLQKYGVSTLDFNAKYKRTEGIFLCFDKPSSYLYGDIILNLSKEKFFTSCIDDLQCEIEFYSGNTDVTAIASALVKSDFNYEKNIYIKKIIINT